MSAVQFGVPFTLIGPDGTRAVFNDPLDVDYIGVLTDATGLDSPEIVESGENLVGMDGGIHGDFYYGRRPVVLEGIVLNPLSTIDRNDRMDKLSRAAQAMRADATLLWQPDGRPAQRIQVRAQQPLRFSGTWQKGFQVSLVAADPRIYSDAVHASQVSAVATTSADIGRGYDMAYNIVYGPGAPNGQLLVNNTGNTDTYPVLTIQGPAANPIISNLSTGQSLYINYTLSAGEFLVIDTLNRTIMLGGTASRYSALDFARSEWWPLVPGLNDIRLAFSQFTTGAFLRVDWRDAWI